MAIDPKKATSEQQVQQLIAAMGSMGEMAHTLYNSVLQAGANKREAEMAMTAWISAFWHETMEDARRKNGGQQDAEAE